MEIFNLLFNNIMLVSLLIGGIAFLVSVFTEVTKNLGFLSRIPTDLQVIVISILLCQLAYFAYTSYFKMDVQWYYIAGCFIAAFIVSFVAMYGWEKLTTLYNRFKK